MIFRSRLKNFPAAVRAAMACLLVFNVLYFATRLPGSAAGLWPDAIDGARGFFLGAAIVLIYKAFRMRAEQGGARAC